jgi:hypothetical protein
MPLYVTKLSQLWAQIVLEVRLLRLDYLTKPLDLPANCWLRIDPRRKAAQGDPHLFIDLFPFVDPA